VTRVVWILACALTVGSRLVAQDTTAYRAAYDSLLREAEKSFARGDRDLAIRQLLQRRVLADGIDHPQFKFSAHYSLAAAYARGDTSAASAIKAAYAMDTAMFFAERTRRAYGASDRQMDWADVIDGLYEEWFSSSAERARLQGLTDQQRLLVGLAIFERARSPVLTEALGVAGNTPLTPGRLLAEGERLHALAVAQRATVLNYYVTKGGVAVFFSGVDSLLRFDFTLIADTALATLVTQARAALGVDAGGGSSGLAASLSGVRGVQAHAAIRPDSTALSRLRDILLPPPILAAVGAARTGQVMVIPHRSIALVPFTALPSLRRVPIGTVLAFYYVPSLTVLEVIGQRPPNPFRTDGSVGSAVVVGNPTMPQVQTPRGRIALDPLPGSEREARWVAQRLGTRALLGDSATETRVWSAMRSASIIHLATHGFAFTERSWEGYAFVALARDQANDGLLRVRELEARPNALRAELVVISACESGLGATRQSEGILGLPRAFLLAGARNVLATLWSVDDDATEFLMRRFYTHFFDPSTNVSLSVALWKAQNDLRADPRFSHPRFWAAFQLIGST
jgi:hypothetical protein